MPHKYLQDFFNHCSLKDVLDEVEVNDCQCLNLPKCDYLYGNGTLIILPQNKKEKFAFSAHNFGKNTVLVQERL